ARACDNQGEQLIVAQRQSKTTIKKCLRTARPGRIMASLSAATSNSDCAAVLIQIVARQRGTLHAPCRLKEAPPPPPPPPPPPHPDRSAVRPLPASGER